ncbi:MAG: hypothetical protein ACTHJ3_14355 [Pararhizobium sp.]
MTTRSKDPSATGENRRLHEASAGSRQTARHRDARISAVIAAAEESGLLGGKAARIGGRVSPALLERARRNTGIEADTDLIEFALANLALADDFPAAFREMKGSVDPTLDLDF